MITHRIGDLENVIANSACKALITHRIGDLETYYHDFRQIF